MSPQIQNEFINCVKRLKMKLLTTKAYAYSIIADETSDISEKEQLSISVRFLDEEKMAIREEFLRFVELAAMDAKIIATTIDNFLQNGRF